MKSNRAERLQNRCIVSITSVARYINVGHILCSINIRAIIIYARIRSIDIPRSTNKLAYIYEKHKNEKPSRCFFLFTDIDIFATKQTKTGLHENKLYRRRISFSDNPKSFLINYPLLYQLH